MPTDPTGAILALEKKYWDTMIAKDVDAAVAMSDDPCIVTGAQGVSRISREQYRALMSGGTWTLRSYVMSDVQARMIGDDVAIIAYKVHEELTVDGKPLTLDANDASTWMRRDGAWKCALHTEAVAGGMRPAFGIMCGSGGATLRASLSAAP